MTGVSPKNVIAGSLRRSNLSAALRIAAAFGLAMTKVNRGAMTKVKRGAMTKVKKAASR